MKAMDSAAEAPPSCGRDPWKRAFDVVVALIGLVVASPLLTAACVAIWLEDGGSPFYFQDRAGRDGTPFRLLKLRSMRPHDLPDGSLGHVTPSHPLITRTGRAIRRLKVDELPQLWNVLRGEMSLVGPRPTIPQQAEQYDAFEARRLGVAPGLTGWAQVNGNVELSWEDRILLDVYYVAHRSLLFDLRIVRKTIGVVLRGESPNISALEQAREYAVRVGWRSS